MAVTLVCLLSYRGLISDGVSFFVFSTEICQIVFTIAALSFLLQLLLVMTYFVEQ